MDIMKALTLIKKDISVPLPKTSLGNYITYGRVGVCGACGACGYNPSDSVEKKELPKVKVKKL